MQWDQQIFVAELNVEHFRHLLAGELDAAQRRTISALLAEEEARLIQLKTSAIERVLSRLIDLLAQRSSDLFDGALFNRHARHSCDFVDTLSRLPAGIALVDEAGEVLLANLEMQRFVPKRIPSRDGEQVRRWHFETEEGPLTPFRWPGARALRGDPVNPGLSSVFISDDGRRMEVRVAAVPVRDSGTRTVGALTTVYDLTMLISAPTSSALTSLLDEEESRRPIGEVGSGCRRRWRYQG